MRPTFVLSLDEELVWGSFDHTSPERFDRAFPDLRGVVRDILSLLTEFDVSATWGIVGHLFLQSCERSRDGRAHAELPRPRFSWYPGDWYSQDPCTSRDASPLWYGDDVVDLVASCPVRQEIASHSFGHLPYGDPGCATDVVEADLRACVAAAGARGLNLKSFIFARNSEGHHDLLRKHGFSSYRGADPTWFRTLAGPTSRLAHFIDQAIALEPPVSNPRESLPGLWNIPGSMILLPRIGIRKLVSGRARILKARRGLRAAIRAGSTFHLWLHPFNLCVDRELMTHCLSEILRDAAELRERGEIAIRTMDEMASQLATDRIARTAS